MGNSYGNSSPTGRRERIIRREIALPGKKPATDRNSMIQNSSRTTAAQSTPGHKNQKQKQCVERNLDIASDRHQVLDCLPNYFQE
jgi:hypothetical protein